jgi:hypothetical protein
MQGLGAFGGYVTVDSQKYLVLYDLYHLLLHRQDSPLPYRQSSIT